MPPSNPLTPTRSARESLRAVALDHRRTAASWRIAIGLTDEQQAAIAAEHEAIAARIEAFAEGFQP